MTRTFELLNRGVTLLLNQDWPWYYMCQIKSVKKVYGYEGSSLSVLIPNHCPCAWERENAITKTEPRKELVVERVGQWQLVGWRGIGVGTFQYSWRCDKAITKTEPRKELNCLFKFSCACFGFHLSVECSGGSLLISSSFDGVVNYLHLCWADFDWSIHYGWNHVRCE